jgi:putative hydrolase of the HAD superfamily
MPRKIEVVLFDLDDTLHDDTNAYLRAAERVSAEVASERAIDPAILTAAYAREISIFWGGLNVNDLSANIGRVRKRLWQRALRSVGLDDERLAERCAQRYNEYRRGYLELYPGAFELLQNLRKEGKRVGLVTNGFAETHHEKITLLKLRELLDGIFIADEVGMVKPDPELFVHACRVLGSAPERSAMVGDRYERDIRGAAEAGLYTIWVNVRAEELPAGAPPPDAVCEAIVDVGPILRGVEAASAASAQGS